MVRAVLAGLLACVACKSGERSDHAPDPVPVSPPSPSASIEARPTITVGEIAPLLPAIDRGDAILPPQVTADHHQLHATWCIAGTGADEVAKRLDDAMRSGGWIGTSRRGDGVKAGVSGERDRYRLSFVVTASTTPTCTAPTHYFASATAFRVR